MRLCALSGKHFSPFLLAPLLAAPVAAATWFVTVAAGVVPLHGQLASAAAFVIFSGGVTLYVSHCMNRYPSRNRDAG